MSTATYFYPTATTTTAGIEYLASSGELWECVDDPYSSPSTADYIYEGGGGAGSYRDVYFQVPISHIPKSSGFGDFKVRVYAKRIGSSVKIHPYWRKYNSGSTWVGPVGDTSLTTSYTWYNLASRTTTFAAYSYYPTIELHYRKGFYDTKDGVYESFDSDQLVAIHISVDLYTDTAAPSIPTQFRVGGHLLPIAEITDTSSPVTPTTVPTLSLYYQDTSNATYSNNYDESSVVVWEIGTATSSNGVVGTIIYSNYATVASVNSWITIPWPGTSTRLDYGGLYTFRTKVFDAASNDSGWSAVGTFRIQIPPATWWRSGWTRRKLITFGNDHDLLPKGYTVELPFNSGVFKTLATNGHFNESIQHSGRMVERRGNKLWFSYRSQGALDNNSFAYFGYLNTDTNEFGTISTISISNFDTHYYPSFGIDPSGYIYVIISGHGDSQQLVKSEYPNVADFDISKSISLRNGSYPRIQFTSSGTVFITARDENEHSQWLLRQTNTNVDNYPTFGAPVWIAGWYSGEPLYSSISDCRIYCGGYIIDKNNRHHIVVNHQEGDNINRTIKYAYSDDYTNWYSLGGTLSGVSETSYTNVTNGNISCIKLTSAGNVASAINVATGTRPHTNNDGLLVTNTGTVIFSYTKQPSATSYYYWVFKNGDPMVVISQPGSTWATTNLYEETGYKNWMHRHSGCLQYFYNVDYGRYQLDYYYYTETPTEDLFAGELIKCSTSDSGLSWSWSFLTKNSTSGIGMLSGVGSCQDRPEIITGRGRNVDYYNGQPPGTIFLPYGDDVRVVMGTRELSRLTSNYWNYEDTNIIFSLQSTIPTNAITCVPQYYLYYGNYFALATVPHNIHEIVRHYQGFNTMDIEAPATINGWSITGAPDYYYVEPHYGEHESANVHGSNKLYDGAQTYAVKSTSDSRYLRGLPTLGDMSKVSLSFAQWITSWFPVGSIFMFSVNTSPEATPIDYSFEDYTSFDVDGVELQQWTLESGYVRYNTTHASLGNGSCKVLASTNYHCRGYGDLKSSLFLPNYATLSIYCFASYNSTAKSSGAHAKFWLENNGQVLASYAIPSSYTSWTKCELSLPTTPTLISRVYLGAATLSAGEEVQALYDVVELAPRQNKLIQFSFNTGGTLFISTDYFSKDLLKFSGLPVNKMNHYSINFGNTNSNFSYYNSIATLGSYLGYYNSSGIASFWIQLDDFKGYYDAFLFKDYVDNPPSVTAGNEYVKDYIGTSRIMNLVELAYFGDSRVANYFDTEKEVVDHIANILSLSRPGSTRIGNALRLERERTTSLANLLVGDKELTDIVANIVAGDKTLTARVAHFSLTEKTILHRIGNQLVTDKAMRTRMSHIVHGDKATDIRIMQLLTMNKELVRRICNTIVADKTLLDRVSNYLTTDKEVVDEISNIISGDKATIKRIAQYLITDKEVLDRISNIVTGDKEIVDRYANIVSFDKSGDDRLAQILELDKELTNRIAQSINTDKTLVDRLANTISGDKTLLSRVANILVLDKLDTDRFAQIVVNDKVNVYRMAMRLFGDKEVAERLANRLLLEETLQIRIANHLVISKALTARLANTFNFDKTVAARIANSIEFVRYLVEKYAQDIDYEAEKSKQISQSASFIIEHLFRIAAKAVIEKKKVDKLTEEVTLEKLINLSSFSQMIDSVALKTSIFAQNSTFYKDFYKNIAEILHFEKGKSDIQYTQIVDFIANELKTFSEDLDLVAEKISTMAQSVDFAALVTTMYGRLAELIDFDKEFKAAFTEAVSLVVLKTKRFSEYVNLISEVATKYTENVDFEAIKQSRYAGDVEFYIQTTTLTQRLAAYGEFISTDVLGLCEFAEFVRTFLPDLVLARNIEVV